MKFLAYPVGILSLTLGLVGCQARSTTTQAADSLKQNTTLPGSDEARNRPPVHIDGMPVDTANPADPAAPVSKIIFKKLTWDTSGGGDLHYSIAPNDDAGKEYTLSLTARSFRTYSEHYSITKDTGALYKKIGALFRGKLNISSPTPSDAPTGTWSTLKLFDLANVVTEFKSPIVANTNAAHVFEELRSFIEEQISSNTTDCSTLASLAGTWKSSNSSGTLSSSTTSTMNKVETTDGSVQYSGTDDTETSGCFGSTCTSNELKYTYQQDKCILTQVSTSGTEIFKITYISMMPGFTKIKLSECEDASCAALKEGKNPISLIQTTP